MIRLAGAAIVVCIAAAAAAADSPAGADAERVAASTAWAFDREAATAAGCAAHGPWGRYAITVEGDQPYGERTIVVKLGDEVVHRARGNAGSVFTVVGDRLYYAVPEQGSQGGEIVAVDLA